MANELVTAEQMSKELGTNVTQMWDGADNTAGSIIIPKIMVMQGLSKGVTDGIAKFGDFVDSLTSEVLGSISKPFEFIPIHLEKELYISENKSKDPSRKDFKYVRKEKLTAANENLPWSDVVNGVEVQRTQVFNFYVLNPKDMTLPYILSFKGKSLRNGKVFYTSAFVKAQMAGSFPPAYHYVLKGTKESNDKGTFVVIATERAQPSTKEEIGCAVQWKKQFSTGAVQAHDVEENDYVAPSTHATVDPEF